ncbi:CGNR zinc finger domain-containing protein [Biostraticola tofi]|uniref:Putative RNA-binding Zn ribbon-like protein n=1 Tax=Biostraticola tofi TaxID=466109 RepID=A0A4R3YWC5_9GAMM|nr:ABATE domain-containing protein [Biostraticola tofi]TCV96806.1 putative RNA-binding Zn ribbon-like protein [Biostraticola tofi]
MTLTTKTPAEALFIADNVALDFINTEHQEADSLVDCLTDDSSVVAWLKQAGQLPQDFNQVPEGLFDQAQAFRNEAKQVVLAAMHGARPELSALNRVLESGRPVREIEWNGGNGKFNIVRRLRSNTPMSLLEPIAESLAKLLISDKFDLVRQCEAPDCILFFHDLTKSHRRRWCSMSTCGNRMKVAAFRSRKKQD